MSKSPPIQIRVPSTGQHLDIYSQRGFTHQLDRAVSSATQLPESGGAVDRVKVTVNTDNVLVEPVPKEKGNPAGSLPFVAPAGLPRDLDASKLRGEMALGCFPMVVDQQGRLLMVFKRRPQFWYIPGGLLDAAKDKGDLRRTALRELKEETGVELPDSTKLTPCVVYESVTPLQKPRRHNLMIGYVLDTVVNAKEIKLQVQDTAEIEKVEWIFPHVLWSSFENLSPTITRESLGVFLCALAQHRLGTERYLRLVSARPRRVSPILFSCVLFKVWWATQGNLSDLQLVAEASLDVAVLLVEISDAAQTTTAKTGPVPMATK